MKRITDIFKEFAAMLETVCPDVSHYWADAEKSNRYIIWQETGEGDQLNGDNRRDALVLSFDIELYVSNPLDPAIDAMQSMLDACAISWTYDGATYESDTNLIHHSWRCDFG